MGPPLFSKSAGKAKVLSPSEYYTCFNQFGFVCPDPPGAGSILAGDYQTNKVLGWTAHSTMF